MNPLISLKILCLHLLFFSNIHGEIKKILIYDFKNSNPTKDWYVVNDNVMGGYSKGALTKDRSGNGLFLGNISLYNNGGFSSIRYNFKKLTVSPYDTLILNLNGDNKYYQLRIKNSNYDRHVYTKKIFVKNGWNNLKVALKDMQPTFRGRKLRMNNFDGTKVTEIGILIGNQVAENFNLRMSSIFLKKSIE